MRVSSFFVGLSLLVFPHLVLGQSARDTISVIETSGLGELTLPPDRVVILIDVSTRESSANAATTKNSALVKRVVDSLSSLRTDGDTVQLTAVSVHDNRSYPEGKFIDYEASSTVRVALRPLDQLGHIIDAAFAAGATRIDNITFLSDKQDDAVIEALGRAYHRAEKQAQALAAAAGLRLGSLSRISTGYSPSFSGGIVTMGAPQISGLRVGGYGQAPISPQDIRVTANVSTTWRVERR